MPVRVVSSKFLAKVLLWRDDYLHRLLPQRLLYRNLPQRLYTMRPRLVGGVVHT